LPNVRDWADVPTSVEIYCGEMYGSRCYVTERCEVYVRGNIRLKLLL